MSVEGTSPSPLGFTDKDLDDEFFTQIAKALGIGLTSWEQGAGNTGLTMTTSLSDDITPSDIRLKGVFKFIVRGTNEVGEKKCFELAVRFKLNNHDNSAGWVAIYERFEEDIYFLAKRFVRTSLNFSRASELEVLVARRAMKDPFLAQFLPNVYHTRLDSEKEHFIVVTDFIDQDKMMNANNQEINYEIWDDQHRFKCLKEFAKFHSTYLDNTDDIADDFGDVLVRSPPQHLACKEWFQAVVNINAKAFPNLYTAKRLDIISRYFDNLQKFTEELMAYPMSFVHNDAHTGNLWLRRHATEGKSDLILYDWELCCINVPQRDLVFFLICVIPPQSTLERHLQVFKAHTAYYQKHLVEALQGRDKFLINKIKDRDMFDRIVYLQMFELLLNRSCLIGALPRQHVEEPYLLMVENVLSYIEAQADEYGSKWF